MAFPNRQNARMGLPSNPRSRSVIVNAPRADLPPRPSSAAGERPRLRTTSSPSSPPRSLRAQRSMVDLTSASDRMTRDVRPPVPPLPLSAARMNDASKTHPARKGSSSSINTSSSGSSWDASQSKLGYTSSSTSVDDDTEDLEKKDISQQSAPGFGSSLWSRVAAAAGSLTVSVSKAWEANIAGDGEVTPPGHESRLTRVMKAYHIAKARSPADLPGWLFDERERGVTSRLVGQAAAEPDTTSELQKAEQPQPFRIKDIVVLSKSNGTRPSGRPSVPDDAVAPMSRAAQRLKEMAEAKRNPKISKVQFVEPVHPRRAGAVDSAGDGVGTKQMSFVAKSSTRKALPPPPRADVTGRQPSPRGLPTGVRPQRR